MSADIGSSEGGEGTEEEQQGMSVAEEAQTQPGEQPMVEASETTTEAPSQPVEGRRTQLKIVRETIESLSKDIGSFRKSQEANARKLESQVLSLRKDLASHLHSKDLGNHVKKHETDAKRLEKEITKLRKDLVELKAHVSKETAKARAKEEAALSKMLAKATKKPKPSKVAPAKHPKKKKS